MFIPEIRKSPVNFISEIPKSPAIFGNYCWGGIFYLRTFVVDFYSVNTKSFVLFAFYEG